ncbi:thymidine phosphorylase [bacterium]|nr:thymidine phosphorylase [bacterium]
MLPYEIIFKKRNGQSLERAILEEFVQGFVEGRIPDYQMAAFLMAVYFRGLTADETTALTEIMVGSGQRLRLDCGRETVDKHSTGGVGDKISFPLVPLLASCGLAVPMISGRGLGHTGGTLDKFEAIPGLTTDLTVARFLDQLSEIGMVIAGQTHDFVPADKKMYALRDVTATVDSIPLIAASIMSKKIAEGVRHLVLDVKTGAGAFMTEQADAEALARTMISIGMACGLNMRALITDMSQPLGQAVGNALEINESVDVLRGRGPADVRAVTLALCSQALVMARVCSDLEQAEKMLLEKLTNGQALSRFLELINAQGGQAAIFEPEQGYLPAARYQHVLTSTRSGYVTRVRPKEIGLAVALLGGGRMRTTDTIDPSVGLTIHVKCGEYVQAQAELMVIYYNHEDRLDQARPYLTNAVTIQDEPVSSPILIKNVIAS